MEALARQLPPKAYRRFWSSLFSSRAAATQFLASALSLLTQLETSAPAPGGSVGEADPADLSTSPQQAVPIEGPATPSASSSNAAMLRALHYAATFAPFNAQASAFKSALDSWSSVSGARQDAFTQELLATLLLGNPTDPFWNWAEKCLQTHDRTCPVSLAVLRQQAMDADCFRKIGADVVAQVNAATRPGRHALGALRLLRLFVTICPHDTTDMVAAALPVVRQRCLLPGLTGSRAMETLTLLIREAAVPGSAQRDSIFLQFPDLSLISPVEREACEGPALVIAEESSDAALLLTSMLQFWTVRTPTLTQLRYEIVANLMSRVLGVEAKNLGLQFLTPDVTSALYKRSMEFCKTAHTMDPSKSRPFLWKKLSNLHKDAMFGLRNVAARQDPQELRKPPMEFEVFSIPCASDASISEGVTTTATELRIPVSEKLFSTLLGRLSCLQSNVYEGTTLGTSMRIGLVGSDRLLFAITGAFVQLNKEAPQLLDSLQLKLYIIPSADCLCSAELQRVDPWYEAHVAEAISYATAVTPGYPFGPGFEKGRQKQATPQRDAALYIEDTTGEYREGRDDLLREFSGRVSPNPPSVVASVVESLFREANTDIPVRIVFCQCFTDASGKPFALMTLPFLVECIVFMPADPSNIRSAKPQQFSISASYMPSPLAPGTTVAMASETRRVHSVRIKQDWEQGFLEMSFRSEEDMRRGRKVQGCEVAQADLSAEGGRSVCISVDRQIFGPFVRVCVYPSPFSLPFMSFDVQTAYPQSQQ